MLPLDFDSISSEHIRELFDNQVAESPRLEFKRNLLSKQTEERKNVLFEIAAFANTDGGDLVFGITDRKDGDNKNMGIADGCTPLRLITRRSISLN
jgi:predicted HTH transcriptional regulator